MQQPACPVQMKRCSVPSRHQPVHVQSMYLPGPIAGDGTRRTASYLQRGSEKHGQGIVRTDSKIRTRRRGSPAKFRALGPTVEERIYISGA